MEFKDRADFEKWVQSFRKLGVKSLKHGQFEIELSPEAPESAYLKKKKDEAFKENEDHQAAEAERLAFWSSAPLDMPGGAQ